MYYRSNQDAAQQGHYSRLTATIAHRRAQWGVCTKSKRSEEGRIETTWLKVKKKKRSNYKWFTHLMREVHLYEYSSFTIRQFRFALCAVWAWAGSIDVCVCVIRFCCCYTIQTNKCTFITEYFNLWCLLHVSNPRVHLQEGGCTYRYGIVCMYVLKLQQKVFIKHLTS